MALQLKPLPTLGAFPLVLMAGAARAQAGGAAAEAGLMFYGSIVAGLVVLAILIAWLFSRLRDQTAPHHHAVNPHDMSEWQGLGAAPPVADGQPDPTSVARRSGVDRRSVPRPEGMSSVPRAQPPQALERMMQDTVGFGPDDLHDIPIPRHEATDSMPQQPARGRRS